MLSHARKITVDGQVWQWKVRARHDPYENHECVIVTAKRVEDGRVLQARYNRSVVTPKDIRELILTRTGKSC